MGWLSFLLVRLAFLVELSQLDDLRIPKSLLWIWDYSLSLLKHGPFELCRIGNWGGFRMVIEMDMDYERDLR